MSVNAEQLKKCQWMSATFEVSESLMMKGLDLETRNLAENDVTAEGVQQRASGIDAEARRLHIDEARREAELLLEDLADLPQRSVALLGAGAPATQSLAQTLQQEADSRTNPHFGVDEPDRAQYAQARKAATEAREALRQAAVVAREAIRLERERRQQALSDLALTLQAQPLPTWPEVLQRVGAYLPDNSLAPAALKQQAAPLEGLQQAAAQCHDSGTPQAFDDALREATQAAAAALQALQEALQAEVDERQRRVDRDQDLQQRRAAHPLDGVAALELELIDKVGPKKDARLTSARDAVIKARTDADALLQQLPGLLDGAAAPFDALALRCDGALDDLTREVAAANTQLQARQRFTACTITNRPLITWAYNKASGEDPRLLQFRVFWKGLDAVLNWVDMDALHLPTLQGWVVTLGVVEAESIRIQNEIPTAQNLLKDGQALSLETTQLSGQMAMDEDALGRSYPALARLCTAVLRVDDDHVQLQYPGVDLAAACRYLDDILRRWTPLVADARIEIVQLRTARSLMPLVAGAIVIKFSPQLKAKNVTDVLPIVIGNANSIASDLINSPNGGATLFYVGGHRVYHSSAGSGSTSDAKMGSVFWILQDDSNLDSDREIVCVGKHITNKSNVYSVAWLAAGASCWYNKDVGQQQIHLGDAKKGLG